MNRLVDGINTWLKAKGLYEQPEDKGSPRWFRYWAFWIGVIVLGMVILMLVIVGFKGLLRLMS